MFQRLWYRKALWRLPKEQCKQHPSHKPFDLQCCPACKLGYVSDILIRSNTEKFHKNSMTWRQSVNMWYICLFPSKHLVSDNLIFLDNNCTLVNSHSYSRTWQTILLRNLLNFKQWLVVQRKDLHRSFSIQNSWHYYVWKRRVNLFLVWQISAGPLKYDWLIFFSF